MLNELDSHYLLNSCQEQINMATAFEIVKGTGATMGIDGNQYYYGFGNIAEPTGVFGFGKTPASALLAFSVAYYSQTVNKEKS